jgi:phage replication O-like protein O
MANPQLENGYMRIANEITINLVKFDLLGSELRILIFIMQKTYGFNKKEDYIALSIFGRYTGISKPTIVKALKNLTDNGFINRKGNIFSINKDHEKWGGKAGLTSKAGLTRTGKHRLTQSGKDRFTYKRQLKTILKDNKNKKNMEYEFVDNEGNPLKKKGLTRITKDQNNFLISVGFLWIEMAHRETGMPKDEIPYRNINFILRKCWEREKFKWDKDDFKQLFTYFFKDRKINQESKLSYDLCLSEKYVAQYKLKQRSKPKTNASIAGEIRL